MRIIPKKTNVKMEFFKGIGVMDILIIAVGGAFAFSILLSDFPFHIIIFCMVLMITVALVIPVDDEKSYMSILHAIKYVARYKLFKTNEKKDTENETKGTADEKSAGKSAGKEKKEKKVKYHDVKEIIPFTAIDDDQIVYGTSYFGMVISVPSVEYRFYSLERQDNMIDHVLGSVLRTAAMNETIEMVKLERPIIYDEYIKNEEGKIDDLKEAFLNGLINEEELTTRVGIVHDRISMIETFNYDEKVYVPFHYIAFYYKNKDTLREQVDNAIRLFSGNDMDCKILKGPELAIFLKYNYTQVFDEREAYSLDASQYIDWIIPKKIAFAPRTVTVDELVTHNLKINKYPTIVGNAWGSKIFSMPGTRAVLKMKPLDRYKSIKQIDRAIDELREQSENTGKASKQMELATHIDTLGEVLRLLQGDNETLFSVDLFITIYDYEYSTQLVQYREGTLKKKPYTKVKRDIKRKLSEDGYKATDMYMQQFEAYAATSPSANDNMSDQAQSIHSGSIAAAFPYVNKYLSDKDGLYIGNSDGIPAYVNFFQRDKDRINSNAVIIGKSGSGKSYATKTILTQLAADDSKIFILDPENEYSELAHNLNGKVIDVGSATQGRLNPFHVITNLSDDDNEEELQDDGTPKKENTNTSLNMHLQFLEEFYRQILPGIEPDALEYLNNITSHLYEQKGIDADTDLSTLSASDFPNFDDLYEKLLNDFQVSTGEYSKKNLRVLLNYISKFATGGRNSNLWNGESTISTNENFIVFNFQSLLANKNNTIASAQMLLVLKWLDNEIIKNRDYNMKYKANRKIIVVIDEAHVFINSKYPVALDFMFQLAKRIRKYNGMQIVITQNIKDFVGTEEIAAKSTAIINASQYSFIFPLAPNDMQDLCKLYEKAGSINEAEQNDIVNNGRGRAFVITSPSERTCVDIIAGKDIERLFTM